jgi:Zn-finger nucleic acid-binding protein
MLRVIFSRLGQPYVGPSFHFSFNVPTGMCPRCEGMGVVSDIDVDELVDRDKSLTEGAITIPGYTADGWMVRIYSESGFLDPDKKIRDYTEQELHDFLYKEPVKVKVQSINMSYEGLVPKVQKGMLSKDRDAMQPHIRAFVDRAVTFTTCPECGGSRLNQEALSSKIKGINIADAAAMQISDLAGWLADLDDPSIGPLVETLRQTIDSFVEIGLGYLSLDRTSGTLSGGEAQRVKMIRHLGSPLTDVTYVFDEPTVGLHPHDIQRMNELLLRLRDKGNTVLVVEHKPEVVEIADHVVDLGPGAGATEPSMSELFPDPATPVSTTSTPSGMSTSTPCRLWVVAPRISSVPVGVRTVSLRAARSSRWRPVMVSPDRSPSTVPSKQTAPPAVPAPGPRSTTWSAIVIVCGLCSTTSTVLPLSRSRSSSSFIRRTSWGCRPMVGSSKT